MSRKALVLVALLALWSAPASAQITIPYTFANGQIADADQVNADMVALSGAALNRTGGTVTGNLLVNAGVTIDGIDIGAVLGGTGNPTFSTVTATGNIGAATLTTSNTGAASLDVAGGINAGTGNVGIVDTTGKIPALSSTFFANLSGTNVTNLNASNISSGTVPLANISGITNTEISAAAAIAWTKVSKAGSSLADLATRSATDLTSGALPDARLSGTYSNSLTFSGAVTTSGVLTRSAGYVADASIGTQVINGGSQTVTLNNNSIMFISPTNPTDTVATITGGVEGRIVSICVAQPSSNMNGFVGGGNMAGVTAGLAQGTCMQFIFHGSIWYILV
jgi:hypothetical protein